MACKIFSPCIEAAFTEHPELERVLLETLARPAHFDSILKVVCDKFSITLDCCRYALVGSNVRSFLSYLYNEDKLRLFFDANVLYWESLP